MLLNHLDRGAETCLSLSHHHAEFLRRDIFALRQLFIIVPANKSGQVAAVLQRRPCGERFQRRKRGEPEKEMAKKKKNLKRKNKNQTRQLTLADMDLHV